MAWSRADRAVRQTTQCRLLALLGSRRSRACVPLSRRKRKCSDAPIPSAHDPKLNWKKGKPRTPGCTGIGIWRCPVLTGTRTPPSVNSKRAVSSEGPLRFLGSLSRHGLLQALGSVVPTQSCVDHLRSVMVSASGETGSTGGYAMSLHVKHRALVLVGLLSMGLLGVGTVTAEGQTVTYSCRWDKVSGPGGAWSTGWVPGHPTPYCGASAVNRVCGSSNFSAAQPSGTSISYWPQGCAAPSWIIQCTCKPG